MNSANVAPPGKTGAKPAINFFERYLTVWVALCIVIGVALGQAFPDLFQRIGRMEYAQVNLPVGLLIMRARSRRSAIASPRAPSGRPGC